MSTPTVRKVVTRKKAIAPVTKQITTKEEWFEAKLKYPTKYSVSPQGDLITSSDPGASTIELIPQVPASVDFIQDKLDSRNEKRLEAESRYTTAKRALFDITKQYKAKAKTLSDVLNANQEVHNAECILNSITKDPRYIKKLEGLMGKELYDNPYDASKIAEPVLAGAYTPFPWSFFWMDKPEEKIPEEPLEDEPPQEGGTKKEKTPEEKARIWAIIRAKMAKKHHSKA